MLTAKPLGIIDTLSEGFASLNRHLWILLLPVAVDLLLAFGPGVTSTSIVDQLLNQVETTLSAEEGEGQDSGLAAGFREDRGDWLQVNLLTALTLHLPSAVTVTALVPKVNGPVIADIEAWPVWFVFIGSLIAAGLGLVSVYLTGLAGCIRANPPGVYGLLVASRRTFKRLLAFYGLLVFVGLPGFMFIVMVLTVVGMVVPLLASLLGTLLLAAFMLAAFYTAFAEEAIVLNGSWPIPAVLASASVVFRHFWTTLGFMALTFLIAVGVPVVWRLLVGNPAGLLAVIVAHAYLSSGIAVAVMLYFWQRQTSSLTVDRSTQSLSQGA